MKWITPSFHEFTDGNFTETLWTNKVNPFSEQQYSTEKKKSRPLSWWKDSSVINPPLHDGLIPLGKGWLRGFLCFGPIRQAVAVSLGEEKGMVCEPIIFVTTAAFYIRPRECQHDKEDMLLSSHGVSHAVLLIVDSLFWQPPLLITQGQLFPHLAHSEKVTHIPPSHSSLVPIFQTYCFQNPVHPF